MGRQRRWSLRNCWGCYRSAPDGGCLIDGCWRKRLLLSQTGGCLWVLHLRVRYMYMYICGARRVDWCLSLGLVKVQLRGMFLTWQ